jgi:alpha-tubulin suppressor-like RCC1 family protein
MLDRLHPVSVSALNTSFYGGMRKVSCGREHAVALTTAGKVFGWGDNSAGQASPRCALKVCSAPTEITLPTGETARDVAAFGNR